MVTWWVYRSVGTRREGQKREEEGGGGPDLGLGGGARGAVDVEALLAVLRATQAGSQRHELLQQRALAARDRLWVAQRDAIREG